MVEQRGSGWWWLAFVDPHRERGTRVLGAAVVYGPGKDTAVATAEALGLRAAGMVQATELAEGAVPSPAWQHRALSPDDIAALRLAMRYGRPDVAA
jgi:hypothetical protein